MGKTYAIGLITAMAASASFSHSQHAYADGPFNFSPFSSPPLNVPQAAPAPPASAPSAEKAEPTPKVRNDNPRTTSAGFDPEALERGAKALREITSSSQAKKVCLFHFFFKWVIGI